MLKKSLQILVFLPLTLAIAYAQADRTKRVKSEVKIPEMANIETESLSLSGYINKHNINQTMAFHLRLFSNNSPDSSFILYKMESAQKREKTSGSGDSFLSSFDFSTIAISKTIRTDDGKKEFSKPLANQGTLEVSSRGTRSFKHAILVGLKTNGTFNQGSDVVDDKIDLNGMTINDEPVIGILDYSDWRTRYTLSKKAKFGRYDLKGKNGESVIMDYAQKENHMTINFSVGNLLLEGSIQFKDSKANDSRDEEIYATQGTFLETKIRSINNKKINLSRGFLAEKFTEDDLNLHYLIAFLEVIVLDVFAE